MSEEIKIPTRDKRDIHATSMKLNLTGLERARSSVEMSLHLRQIGWDIDVVEVRQIVAGIDKLIEKIKTG